MPPHKPNYWENRHTKQAQGKEEKEMVEEIKNILLEDKDYEKSLINIWSEMSNTQKNNWHLPRSFAHKLLNTAKKYENVFKAKAEKEEDKDRTKKMMKALLELTLNIRYLGGKKNSKNLETLSKALAETLKEVSKKSNNHENDLRKIYENTILILEMLVAVSKKG